MLSTEKTKKILDSPDMSDEEAEKIRVGLQDLIDIIFEKWLIDRKKKLQK